MNTLLFSVCALALLSFLRSSENDLKNLADIFKTGAWIFFGVLIFSGLGLVLIYFSGLKIFEIQLLLTGLFFLLAMILRKDISLFAAVSGLSFWVLEYASTCGQLLSGVLISAISFIAFNWALQAFQNKALFYKAPALFAGNPLLMVRSFWGSLILGLILLIFS